MKQSNSNKPVDRTSIHTVVRWLVDFLTPPDQVRMRHQRLIRILTTGRKATD